MVWFLIAVLVAWVAGHKIGEWKRKPQQSELPFWCGHYGQKCSNFVHDDRTGFYGRCPVCGVIYDPPCDR